MQTYRPISAAFVAVAAVALIIVAATVLTRKLQSPPTRNPAVKNQPAGWKTLDSSELGFSAQLPAKIEHKKTFVTTPFGEAPLETFASSSGPARFTVAVSIYDPQIAANFTEEQRFESATETAKHLGGTLVKTRRFKKMG